MKLSLILAIIVFQTIIKSSHFQAACPSNTNYCLSLNVPGGVINGPTPLSSSCNTSLNSDFATRFAIPQFPANCTPYDLWGPHPITYNSTSIPAGCDSTTWQQQRILLLISFFVGQGWNYCHHHTPGFLPNITSRVTTNNTSGGNTGNTAGQCAINYWPNSNANFISDAGWQGIDCTTYTSFVYNFGFGCYLSALTGDQACGPDAPGKVLPYTASQQSQFQVGDILFIASNGSANPLSISHGVLWTGYTLTYDNGPFSNNTLTQLIDPSQVSQAIAYINQQNKTNQPVYIISDSHFAGPNYRPFAGWYVSAFTFARRLINPPSSLPTNSTNARFDGTTCWFTV